tara:strand:+ start:3440 stop:3697 length:258 start_codon:yes stop_codon:yes gene_type:complete
MLKKHEKEALASLFLLTIGGVLCLDRFYESGVSEGLIGLLGVVVAFASVFGIIIWAILVFNKMFRLLRKFTEVSQEEIPKIKGSK